MFVKSRMRHTSSGRVKKRNFTRSKRRVEYMQLHQDRNVTVQEAQKNPNVGK